MYSNLILYLLDNLRQEGNDVGGIGGWTDKKHLHQLCEHVLAVGGMHNPMQLLERHAGDVLVE